MSKVTLLAIDLAKDVFQIAGFTDKMKVEFNRQTHRKDLKAFMANHPVCRVVMEACYSSHYWARCFSQMGHEVRLLPAQHVTPFVRGNKSDPNDTIAIGEASQRPNITPVPIKTITQQDIQTLHRLRDLSISRRTSVMNQARGLLSEYGVISPKGHKAFKVFLAKITDPDSEVISAILKVQFRLTADEYQSLCTRIKGIDKELAIMANQHPLCKLLLTIPGIGPINATAIFCAIGNGRQFSCAREFSVWLGLVPKQSGSGNFFTSGGITKRGNSYLRRQLVHGARAMLQSSKNKTDRLSSWGNALIARRGFNKAFVAMASRLARICWTLMQKNEVYRAM